MPEAVLDESARPEQSAIVRPARPTDASAIVVLLRQLGYERTISDVEGDLQSDIDTVVVADLDGTVVGLLALNLRSPFHHGTVIASIDALVVDEGVRSRGIGNLLRRWAESMASQCGARRIELHSNLTRRRAHGFYERAGYEITSNFYVLEL